MCTMSSEGFSNLLKSRYSRIKELLRLQQGAPEVSSCPHYYGYLGHAKFGYVERVEDAPLPDQCLTCKYLLDCRKEP